MNDQLKARCDDAADGPFEQDGPGEPAAFAGDKRPFVEPSVSVPADVLEATALFQAPTVQTSIVP